jgi:NAD(P)H dehydrogenase (quinone)
MLAITGASGQLGRLAIEQVRARLGDAACVALARDPSRADGLGVAVRHFDYDAPDTLAPALAGVRRLLLVSSSEVGRRVRQHRAVIEAARAAGVQCVVYTSLLHADRSPLDLAAEHLETEALLRASGLRHVVLRNGWYWENHTQSLPGALAAGALAGCAGSGRISWAARADYAEAAAVVLTSDREDGVLELAGDRGHRLEDLAAEVSRQAGRPVPYRDLPPAEYAALLASFGLPQALASAIAGWDAAAARDALFDDSCTLSRLIGRPTMPVDEAVRRALSGA